MVCNMYIMLKFFRKKIAKQTLKREKQTIEKQTNDVFNSKDVLMLISAYIIPPCFSKKDWNTFSRLCKNTSKVANILKQKKVTAFNVDLVSFEKEKMVRDAHAKLFKIDAEKREKLIKRSMNYEDWKLSTSKILDVIKGNSSYYTKSISLNSHQDLLSDTFKIVINETFDLFHEKKFSFFSTADYKIEKFMKDFFTEKKITSNWKIVPSCNLVCHFKSENDCVVLINIRSYRENDILSIVVCNTFMHQKTTIDNILQSSQNDKKYNISIGTDNEKYVVYDFIMNDRKLRNHVEFSFI